MQVPHSNQRGWRLAELARHTGTALEGDGTLTIDRVASLDSAGPGAIAFVTKRSQVAKLATAGASAIIIPRELSALSALPRLVSDDPYVTFAKIAALLHPAPTMSGGIHPTASIDPEARVATTAAIAANAVIGPRALIGERARIAAGCVIGANVTIGDDALLHANVTIYDDCIIGARTILHSGAVIGADGFGLAEEAGRWLKIPQIGKVVIGSDVEIGANTTIDRGALDDTVIEDDVKLDNQIQIGHNCRIGAHTAIAGCVGIAGSVRIGRNCKIGGAAMIAGHLEIPDGTTISAATVVPSSVDARGVYTGVFPITDHATWRRIAAELRHLARYTKRVRALERRLGLHSGDLASERDDKEPR